METLYKKCLYCDEMTHNLHFQSRCCGRGMCDTCYQSDAGTMDQFQIDHMDEEDYKKYVEGIQYDHDGDYLCFDHVKTK